MYGIMKYYFSLYTNLCFIYPTLAVNIEIVKYDLKNAFYMITDGEDFYIG